MPPTVNRTPDGTWTAELAGDVRFYLNESPRQLPSRYLYDSLGSALFDAICRLPWYRVTRAEAGLLERHGAEILERVEPVGRIVELGAGNGEKLALLLSARDPAAGPLCVHLVDVSQSALEMASQAIGSVSGISVETHQARYLPWLEAEALQAHGVYQGTTGTLTMFLGSNIGNFDPPAAETLIRHIRKSMRPGDTFLLGADLIKPERDLLLAYDDPLGVTAAFNKNLLVRINHELGSHIDLDAFRHRAVWNAEHSRVEMHLVSTRAQRVTVPAAGVDITLEDGEMIWTESSYKYRPDDLMHTLERCGFSHRAHWIDPDAGFALMLAGVP